MRRSGTLKPTDLLRLFVFDRRRGQKEASSRSTEELGYHNRKGEEIDKILFFYPEDVPFREQQSLLGLSDGLLTFTRIFSPDFPCETMLADKHRHFFYRCEHDIWMVLVVEKGVYGGADGTTRDDALQAVLREAYRLFVLFNGSISSLLEAYGPSADEVRSRLRAVLPDYIAMFVGSKKLRLPTPSEALSERGTMHLLAVDRQAYMAVQSLVNTLETSFGGETVRYTMLLFDDLLIWSSLPKEDTATLYTYACLSMIPAAMNRMSSSATSMLSSAISSAARGLKKKAASISGVSSLSSTPLAVSAPATPTGRMRYNGPGSLGGSSHWCGNAGVLPYSDQFSPPLQHSSACSPEESGNQSGVTRAASSEFGKMTGSITPMGSPPSLARSDTCISDISVDYRPVLEPGCSASPFRRGAWCCDENGFLVSSAWRTVDHRDQGSGSVDKREGRSGRMEEGSEEIGRKDSEAIPIVYVNGGEPLQLSGYQFKNLTLLMLLPSLPLIASAATSLIKGQLLDKIVQRMQSLDSVLSENWPRPNATHIPGYRYMCFDRMNKVVQASPPGKVSTLSKESLAVLNQVRAEIDAKRLAAERSAGGIAAGRGKVGDVEVCVRGSNNCWVVMRREGERELYVVLEKSSETLVLTSEAVDRLSNRYFDAVFTVD